MSKFTKFKQLAKISITILRENGIRFFLLKSVKRFQKSNLDHKGIFPLTLTSLNENEEKILEENIVWIMGSPRSGSTWLTQLLDNTHSIIWDEPGIGMNLNPINERTQNLYFATRTSYFFSDSSKKKCWLPGIKKLILARTYFQTKTIDKAIIIKEPESYAADLILESLPNSKLIFLLRDGRDVVDSFMDAHQKGSWDPTREPLFTENQRIEKIKMYSHLWVNLTNLVMRAYKNHNPKLRLIIKYEDLLEKPTEYLKKIYEFLGIPSTEDELNKIIEKNSFKNIPSSQKGSGKFTRSASPGNWEKNLSKTEQKIMLSIMGETIKEREYEM